MNERAARTCGTVLAAAQAVDVRLGQRGIRRGLGQHDLETTPLRPAGQDQPVATVAVGTQEIGVDDRDTQGLIVTGRGVTLPPSSSPKAV